MSQKSQSQYLASCRARQLDRLTAPHSIGSSGRTGRSHRLKTTIPMRWGRWVIDRLGWLEADTVSHGSGIEFLNTILESHLYNAANPIYWTRSLAYKKERPDPP